MKWKWYEFIAIHVLSVSMFIGFFTSFDDLVKQSDVTGIITLFSIPAILGALLTKDNQIFGRNFLLSSMLLYLGYFTLNFEQFMRLLPIGLLSAGTLIFAYSMVIFIFSEFHKKIN